MGSLRVVVFSAFAGAVSFTFLLLACALPQYGVWWPMFVLFFYVLAPIPLLIAKGRPEGRDICAFIATVLVFSAYALPVILARAPTNSPAIHWGACALTITANTFMFATIFWLVYVALKSESSDF